MVIFADHELPVVAAAYLITGRFNPEREFEQHATVEPVQLNNSAPFAKNRQRQQYSGRARSRRNSRTRRSGRCSR